MSRTYRLIENHFIVYRDDIDPIDITEEQQECGFCEKNSKTCSGNHQGCYCDQFKILSSITEVFI